MQTDGPFRQRLRRLVDRHGSLLDRPNRVDETWDSGVFERYRHPVLTAEHVPLGWRYDLDERTNPLLLERLGVNAVFNAGAVEIDGRVLLVARVEGADRKSFFAVAESESGTEGFRFWDRPVVVPETDDPATNVYDMRLTQHEDGWVYGTFCAERRDPDRPDDGAAAVASCGIARTRDLRAWERLPDLRTPARHQRNVVLHPELVGGKYAFYTRPLGAFMATGTGEGMGWGLADDIERPVIEEETIFERVAYHTVKEGKLGQGPPPLKTEAGWLHLAHGVRDTAAGMRYVLYLFVTALDDPTRIVHQPGGHLLAPRGDERVGDVSNVLFSNGWVARGDGTVCVYYASSDTRLHVATTSVERLLDYARNTPPDAGRSAASVGQRLDLIDRNRALAERTDDEHLLRVLNAHSPTEATP